MSILLSALQDYPVYALLALSFYISYRTLDFPDLAMDSAFALGMAILVQVVSRGLINTASALAAIAAIVVGFIIGTFLALLHGLRQLAISKLLAGLILSFSLYAAAFRINLYSTTQGLYTKPHLLNILKNSVSTQYFQMILTLLEIGIVFVAFGGTLLLLRSKAGLPLRIVGYRPALLIETGRSPILYLILGLGFAGSLSALAGWLRASSENYSDINTFGTFLYALASLLLGERFLAMMHWLGKPAHSINIQLLAPLIGAFLMSLLVQLSIWTLTDIFKVYLSADIRLVVGLAILASAARSGESFGRSGMAA